MKQCGKCQQTKPDEEFSFKNKETGLRQAWCKTCQNVYKDAHYRNNKRAYRHKNTTRKIRFRDFVRELKNRPCADCGIQYPHWIMEFDHARGVKLFGISAKSHGEFSKERVLAEVDKCDLVCSNCHANRTWLRAHPENGSVG